MSLQGPLIVVAERPATGLVEALATAGAFPIVETKWADAPAAFLTVKPSAVVVAETGPPANDEAARMLCLQVATFSGPVVPVIACVLGEEDAAVPIALPADAALPVQRLLARSSRPCASARCMTRCCAGSNCSLRTMANCRCCLSAMLSKTQLS